MPNYAKTIIYKIVCKDVNITKSYGGHTTHIIKRRQLHKCICNNINSKKYNIYLYQFIRENGGFNNWDMIWCYDYPCKNKREAELEETKFIQKEKCELNCVRPYVSEDEKKEKNKEYIKKNKEKIKKQRKQYFKEYNEKKKEKITCECGCKITKGNLKTHLKTEKHKKLMGKIII